MFVYINSLFNFLLSYFLLVYIGLLFEYNHQLNRAESFGTTYNHLAFGIELLTGGHAFALTFANSRAMNENFGAS